MVFLAKLSLLYRVPKTLFFLMTSWILLKCLSWKKIHLWLNSKTNEECPDKVYHKIHRMALDISKLCRIISFLDNCLNKSLCLWLMSGDHRIFLKIIFGAKNNEGHFQSHSWVVLKDQVILGEHNDSYIPFTEDLKSI